MKKIAINLILFAFALFPTPSLAKDYIFQAKGKVSSIYSADKNFNQVSNPPSLISINDPFSVSFRISPPGAIPELLFDADPTVNIYWYSVKNFRMSAGENFLTAPIGDESNFSTFQLWNDRQISAGSDPVDSFTLSVLRYLPAGTSPVDLGEGLINTQFHYNAFDFTALARGSDSLSELPPLDSYGSRSGFFGFMNGNTYLQTVFQLSFDSASLAAIPEPSSWLMLILGFAIVGWHMRTQQPGTQLLV